MSGENERQQAYIDQTRARLEAVQERMDRHVIGSGKIAEAFALIERMRAEGAADLDIDKALAAKKLPSVIDIAKKTWWRSPSWALLKRKKARLERKLERQEQRLASL